MSVVSEHLATTIYATMCANNADAKELIDLLNGAGSLVILIAMGLLPGNVFRVDTTATAGDAVARVYPTADLAVAAAEAQAVYSQCDIWMTEGQVHAAWTGAGVSGTKSIAFMTGASRGATLPVTLAAPLPAPVGIRSIRFAGLGVSFTADADMSGYFVVVQNSLIAAVGGGARTLTARNITIENTDVVNVLLVGSDALITATLRRSSFTYNVLTAGPGVTATSGVSTIATEDCLFSVDQTWGGGGGTFTLFGKSAGGPETPVLLQNGGQVRMSSNGTINLYVPGYSVVSISGTVYDKYGSVVNFGKAGLIAQLTWHGVDPNDALLPTGAWHNVAGAIVQA